MSFSNDVRAEIQKTLSDRDKRFACLYGILLYTWTFSADEICLQSESPYFSGLISELFHEVFGWCPPLEERVKERAANGVLYSFVIREPKQIEQILQTYQIYPEKREIDLTNVAVNSWNAFLAGVFFICGSVNDPNKKYHMEFVTPTELLCRDLNQVIGTFGVTCGVMQRKRAHVVYLKDSECIEDTLTFMGAQQCTLQIMTSKIHKDMRNKANRLRNCDEANIDKIVSAAMRQTEDIRLLMKYKQLEEMPPEVQEVAKLRLENPELSLKEIGELLTIPLGRSGVNHRFHKLAAAAKELRERYDAEQSEE